MTVAEFMPYIHTLGKTRIEDPADSPENDAQILYYGDLPKVPYSTLLTFLNRTVSKISAQPDFSAPADSADRFDPVLVITLKKEA